MEDKRLKNKNFFDAFGKALSGIWYSIKTQKNIRIQILIAILVIIAGFIFKLSIIEWIFICFAIMFVFITEVINTSIETVVDMYTKEYNELAKIAKDVASGAVLLAAFNSVIVAALILIGRIIKGV